MNKLKNNLKWGDKRINGCEDREQKDEKKEKILRNFV